MKIKIITVTVLALFLCWCGYLVFDSGIFSVSNAGNNTSNGLISLAAETENANQSGTEETDTVEKIAETLEKEVTSIQALDTGGWNFTKLRAIQADTRTVSLGAVYDEVTKFDDPDKFKFRLELTSKGAAIKTATLSEFKNRSKENPGPLELLKPVLTGDKNCLHSLTSGGFQVIGPQDSPLPLDKLDWETGPVRSEPDGGQSVTFSATLMDAEKKDAIRLTKKYTVIPGSYDLNCVVKIQNLTDQNIKTAQVLNGPVGIDREGFRGDMRSIITAWQTGAEKIESAKIDANKLKKAAENNDKSEMALGLKSGKGSFLWAANTNKYFAAILRPEPTDQGLSPDYVNLGLGNYYDPDRLTDNTEGDENISFTMTVSPAELTPAGTETAAKSYDLMLYLGPKDRDVFTSKPEYKSLQFYQTIHFLGCCCPQSVINPLAFAIMGLMKTLHMAIPNYGIVIMIIVALVRLCLHPLTKKSQVSMMGMQKLGPQMEEIKKKYANNKAELQKKTMELYRQQGISPFMGFLPMFVQMPILIALYSAIYASIELRGAPFLPFWITDLSLPDALIPFDPAITVPLLGWQIEAFNLLPVFLGAAMVAQQKLMPSQSAAASTNPQVAQQQKMMMVMMPVMMLIIFYKMPSGLNLYFMSSTAVGVVEQIVIRKHIREKQALEEQGKVPVTSKTGGKVKKKKPKPFFKNTM